MKLLVLNGPNLNLLGTREPDLYGRTTLAELEAACDAWSREQGGSVRCLQSNSEGALIDALHAAREDGTDGVVLNAGGYTHNSVALHDAILACGLPTVEVHLTQVHAREPFRHRSRIAAACIGSIAGFGVDSYRLAILALSARLKATVGGPTAV